MVWSIEQARQSKYIDSVVVSTDDAEIGGIAQAQGILVFNRPAYLSTDEAKTEDVVRHVLTFFKTTDWIVLLQPTSPLRTPEDIDACIERAQSADACVSYSASGQKNGAVYVARRTWIEEHDFSDLDMARYVMPEERSLDIDTEAQLAA